MKIMIIMPSFDDGGVQRIFSKIIKGLSSHKIKTIIITGNSSGALREKFNEAKIYSLDSKLRGDYKLLLNQKKINNLVFREKPDILMSVPGYSSISVIKAASKNNIKSMLVVDNTLSTLKHGKLKHKLSYHLYKHYYKKATTIITAHECAREDIIKNFKIPKEKIKTIYYPLLDLREIKNVKPKKIYNCNSIVLFSAGRLCPEKDYDTLLDAFQIAKKINNNIKLAIAGSGDEEQKIKKQIREKNLGNDVKLLGQVDSIIPYLKSSDIFILTSKIEAFGIVLVEALSCNIKIISTDTASGAQREILENGKLGELCRVKDAEQIASAIIKLCSEKKAIDNSKQVQKYDYSTSIDNYINIIKETLE